MRDEDAGLATGRTLFLADLPFDGLHAVFVRSTSAHGMIRSIDVDEAYDVPGVVAVETAATLDLGPFVHVGSLDPAQARHPLASGRVRHVGEAVAVVLARTPVAAIDAAELVTVDVDTLPATIVPDQSGFLLYEESGTNEVYPLDAGDEPDPTEGAHLVVEIDVDNTRVASAPLEPDGIIVRPGDALDVWCTTQGVHAVRDSLAESLGIDPLAVRVRAPAVGGGFGGRVSTPVEFVVVAHLAVRHGAPVRWVQSRLENLTGMPQGRGVRSSVRLGVDRDGTLRGLDVDATADAGATAHAAGLLMVSMRRQMVGLYRIPELRWRSRARLTNTTPVGAYRGAGQPEANHARERVLDVAARRLGVDPIELRRRNLLPCDELPVEQPGGVVYDDADPLAALDRAVEVAEVGRWRSEQAGRRVRGDRREIGIGVACYAQTSGRGAPPDTALVRVDADGRVVVACGSPSHGQSHAATWRALVADRLGVAPALVEVVDADTAAVGTGAATGGSSASQVLGTAISDACGDLVDAARRAAADRFEVSAADLVVVEAGFGLGAGLAVAGVPTRRVTWSDAAASSRNRCLEAVRSQGADGEAHPYGAHVSVVEVDVETGAVTLLAHTAVDDCGVVLQPVFVEGQQHGGSVAGVSQALFEHVAYDPDGTPLTSSFLFYLLPSAAELPRIGTRTMSTPTGRNALGTRGIGENGCNGATAAAHNAVVDALSPYGVEHVDLPLTPERVWAAVRAAAPTGG
jgi:carbon-monoxide dehydrogenase large subunit